MIIAVVLLNISLVFTHATLLLDVIFVYILEPWLQCTLDSCNIKILQNLQDCDFSAASLHKNFSVIFMFQIMDKPKFWHYYYGFFLFFFSGYKLHRTITERLQEVLENSTYTHSPEPTWLQWNCVSLVNDLYVTVNNWINVERQLIELMGAMWQVFTKSHIPPHFICTGL